MNLRGWPVLRVWRGAAYVRIPVEQQRPIEGGCSCKYCVVRPTETPMWDTLGVPLEGQNDESIRRTTWTLHAPEWQTTDKVKS